MSKHKRRFHFFPVILFLLLLCLLLYATSESLHTVSYTLTTDKVTSPIRLVLLTDLHSCYYGDKQEKLLSAIDKTEPDLICLVGDIFDDETSHQGTIDLLDSLADRYPCYYVTGNHEHWSEEVWVLKALMVSYGVTVLAGDSVLVPIGDGDTTIQLSGIDDPTGFYDKGTAGVAEPDSWLGQLAMVENAVATMVETNAADTPYYTILLSHRPEKVTEYAASPFDLVLSGHAHGGQVRIPFLMNGLFAPNQGWFPDYAGGEYTLNANTTMIVSRGLAKSDLPRIFNRPEVVVVNIEPSNLK